MNKYVASAIRCTVEIGVAVIVVSAVKKYVPVKNIPQGVLIGAGATGLALWTGNSAANATIRNINNGVEAGKITWRATQKSM